MTSLNQLRKDVEVLKRTLLPSPDKKLGEEVSQLLKRYQESLERFHQLPLKERQRILKRWNDTPAVEFTNGSAEMEPYADAVKKASIRNLEAYR